MEQQYQEVEKGNKHNLQILKGIGLNVVFNISSSLIQDVSGAQEDLTTEDIQSKSSF